MCLIDVVVSDAIYLLCSVGLLLFGVHLFLTLIRCCLHYCVCSLNLAFR